MSSDGSDISTDDVEVAPEKSDLLSRIYYLIPLVILASLPVVEMITAGQVSLTIPNILILLATIMCLVTWSMKYYSKLFNYMPIIISGVSVTALSILLVSVTPQLHLHATASMVLIVVWLMSAPRLHVAVIVTVVVAIVAAVASLLYLANLSTENLVTVGTLLVGGVLMGAFVMAHRFSNGKLVTSKQLDEEVELDDIAFDNMDESAFENEHALNQEQNWPQILQDLNKALSSIHDVDVLFSKMLVFMNDVIPCRSACVGMMQDRELKTTQHYGEEDVLVPDVLNWTNEMIRNLAEGREAVNGVTLYDDIALGERRLYRLDVPVLSNDKFVGLVTLIREDKEFAVYDCKLALSIVYQSMTALRNARLYEEFKRLSNRGKQKGLFSRDQFMEASGKQLRKLNDPRSASLMIVEVDKYQAIVDKYGKEVAVSVYNTLANLLITSTRDHDVLGRYGNEGYVILLADTDMLDAKRLAERMRELISKTPCKTTVGKITATVSIGLSSASDSEEDVASLTQRASMALFVAKESGTNSVKVKL